LSAREAGALQDGDVVVLTAGIPVGAPGSTNMLRVETVGDVLIRGTGIGASPATGRVAVIRDPKEASEVFVPGDIVVAPSVDKEFMDFLKQASGLVTEEGGLTSHGAIAGLNLGIPVIVGAGHATRVLKNEMVVTIDPARGLVYKGKARVL
jgi:pyruvate kinase